MIYAILSDIHANLEALSVCLDVCRQLKVDQYLCLGDLIGYNANPAECIQLMRSLPGLTAVKGNHDHYISNGDMIMEGFNNDAKHAVLWTRSQLSNEDIQWLAKLPYKQTILAAKCTLVHATLDSPDAWGYVFDTHHAKDNFAYLIQPVGFCGHSHSPIAFAKKPMMVSKDPRGDVIELEEWAKAGTGNDGYPIDDTQAEIITLNMEPGWKYLVNVGSVGQPRNMDTRASFAIYDTEEKTLSRIKVPYDICSAQNKIYQAGLPPRLATRLQEGR